MCLHPILPVITSADGEWKRRFQMSPGLIILYPVTVKESALDNWASSGSSKRELECKNKTLLPRQSLPSKSCIKMDE